MCGICGIANLDQSPVDMTKLQAMNDAITHRGPDSDGFYLASSVGLAMRRLAIIDLNTGDQPMSNEDESLWIVFNGEIYNFPQLRSELEQRGHQFRTQSDTEVVLHLYEEYGLECVQHLRGMFAFALWDERKKQLFVARDRFGQKPFYYALQRGVFYFSSELHSLLKGLPVIPPIALSSIDLYLSLQYIPDPWTPYEGIYKLPAAHRGVWKDGNWHSERYWQLVYEPKHTAPKIELMAELRERLLEAVRIRLLSDVPLGAHLSGGIDSSIVVALMTEATQEQVKTFSVGFEESTFSELTFARQIANRYQTDHHEFTLTFGDIPATLEQLLQHFGEPFADPSALPLYHLSCLTREHVTVALNGDGGDEAFAGYARYWLDPWANRYNRLPDGFRYNLIPAITRIIPDRGEKPIGQGFVNGLQRLAQVADIDKRASILRWGSYFSPAMKAKLWKPAYRAQLEVSSTEGLLVDTYTNAPAEHYLDRTLYTDITHYLTGDLLVKADRMTMAASLEGRSPFLDHELATWAAQLPQNLRVRGLSGKYLLRQAFSDLIPVSIMKRGKQGFGIPVGAWFRGPLADWARETILGPNTPLNDWFQRDSRERLLDEHVNGRVDHGKRIYALVTLALWASAR